MTISSFIGYLFSSNPLIALRKVSQNSVTCVNQVFVTLLEYYSQNKLILLKKTFLQILYPLYLMHNLVTMVDLSIQEISLPARYGI